MPTRHISIFEGQTIGAIQKAFSDHYPFLKIDFFKNLDLNGIRITKKLDNGYSLFHLPTLEINLCGTTSIQTFKEAMAKATGLMVKVFRKSGNVWIETSLTDDWTLDRQNEEGKLMVH